MRRLLCFQAHSAAEVPAGPAARTAHETLPAAQTYAERIADARSVAGWLTPASAVPLVRALLKRKKRKKRKNRVRRYSSPMRLRAKGMTHAGDCSRASMSRMYSM